MILSIVLQQNINPEQIAQAQKMLAGLLLLVPIVWIVWAFVCGLPYWFICKKAGFSPWLSLLFLIPMGGLVLSYVVGFAEWKVMAAPTAWPPQPPYPPPAPQPPHSAQL